VKVKPPMPDTKRETVEQEQVKPFSDECKAGIAIHTLCLEIEELKKRVSSAEAHFATLRVTRLRKKYPSKLALLSSKMRKYTIQRKWCFSEQTLLLAKMCKRLPANRGLPQQVT